jgi:hypothetical protein
MISLDDLLKKRVFIILSLKVVCPFFCFAMSAPAAKPFHPNSLDLRFRRSTCLVTLVSTFFTRSSLTRS